MNTDMKKVWRIAYCVCALAGWNARGAVGGGSGGTGEPASSVDLTSYPTIFVATNGNNANNGWRPTSPFLTVSNALRFATNGVTIKAGQGSYNLGTNHIILPKGVNLIGAGGDPFSGRYTEFIGYADCSGVELGLSPTGGPQINPGDNSYLANFVVTCDTNSILARLDLGNSGASATHSGSWSGIGVSDLNVPANRTATNVLIENVYIRRSWFDGLHWNAGAYQQITCRRVTVRSDGGDCINAQLSGAGAANQASVYTYEDCLFVTTNSGIFTVVQADGGGNASFGGYILGSASIKNGSQNAMFINCVGSSGGAVMDPLATGPTWFVGGKYAGTSAIIGTNHIEGGVNTNHHGWTIQNGVLWGQAGMMYGMSYSNYTSAATARTMNTWGGKVLLSSGQTTYTVTDNLVSTATSIQATLNAVDATATLVRAVPGSGSFTLVVNAAATANLPITWWIVRP